MTRNHIRFVLFCSIAALVLCLKMNSYAMDTDLYATTGQEVPPNVLIIFDNSSSMLNEDQGAAYDPNTTYSGSYPNGAVYNDLGGGIWGLYKNTTADVLCNAARTALETTGLYNGKLDTDSSCLIAKKRGVSVTLRTGNYLNWQVLDSGSALPRLGLAKGIIHSYINSTDGIRFGIMVFNSSGQGGQVTAECSDDKHGAFNALTNIQPSNVVDWTPLAETLYEAMLYFRGGASYYNPGINYTSPTLYRCAKNYVILVTDGLPTHDVLDDSWNSPIIVRKENLPLIGD